MYELDRIDLKILDVLQRQGRTSMTELGELVGSGKLRPRESIAQGIESAPEAFLGLLKGKNFGKQLVKLI